MRTIVVCGWMRIVSKRTLLGFAENHKYASCASELRGWYKIAKAAKWTKLLDVQHPYPKAEAVPVGDDSYTVFNIKAYRMVVKIFYENQTIFIKMFMTHAEYDRDEWKKTLKKEQIQRKAQQ